ncbi:hypothetical protein CLV24_11555 [Pontibacter ummariensis]|uniref:Uncharacterized protein n=1 Tax=Pontibacter ummariensis TaxID=1610492 RepID=A0A239I008_9BACT|nr:hypothetical protein [Pontibacter ummariensis]PRY10138.1 hypothetical protein CLV24_11555 [Pontibacter ummariensis]SNS86722.1 hypothetical protein SAMN06296052_11555 [Pontibacter ummariensis]
MLENLFPIGSEVFAKVNPDLKLVIRQYLKRIYYCTVQENPTQKELVYFERELIPVPVS